MKGNVCGNCRNFKPKPGGKFFNCTRAEHAGVKYGMQVRADTRSCDAFLPAGVPPMSASVPLGERAQPAGFCPWRRILLLLAALIAVLLASWSIYLSAAEPTETTAPITTPASGAITTPAATSGPTATPAATPAPDTIFKYFDVGQGHQAISPARMVTIDSAQRVASYQLLTRRVVSAPPGMVFVRISVTCTNVGNTRLFVTAGDFLLTDSEGRAYDPHKYDHYYVGRPYVDCNLSPGESAIGTVFWVVPQTASGLEISCLLDSTSTPRVVAKWKLRW